jgi:hypothetical protein
MNDEKNLLINDEKWLELASEYIEGTLPPEMHEKVRVYLESNEQARKEEQELRGILLELSALPEVDPPMFFRENLMKALEAQAESAQQKKPWWQLTRFMQRSLIAGGAFAAVSLVVLVPQLNKSPDKAVSEASLGGKTLAVPTIIGAPLPENKFGNSVAKATSPAQLRVTQGLTKDRKQYEFSLTLSDSPSAMVQVEVPGREAQTTTLKDKVAQAIQVEPDAGKPVLNLGIRWASAGVSQEKQFYVPVNKGDKTAWRNPGEGSTLDAALTNLVAFYGKPVTVENVDTKAVRVPTLVQEANLERTLASRLTPLGLTVTSSNDGVIITNVTK